MSEVKFGSASVAVTAENAKAAQELIYAYNSRERVVGLGTDGNLYPEGNCNHLRVIFRGGRPLSSLSGTIC